MGKEQIAEGLDSLIDKAVILRRIFLLQLEGVVVGVDGAAQHGQMHDVVQDIAAVLAVVEDGKSTAPPLSIAPRQVKPALHGLLVAVSPPPDVAVGDFIGRLPLIGHTRWEAQLETAENLLQLTVAFTSTSLRSR